MDTKKVFLRIKETSYNDLSDDLNLLSEKVVDAVFHVHKNLGAGYPERVYESALTIDLEKRQLTFEKQKILKVIYPPNIVLDPEYRLDLVVEDGIKRQCINLPRVVEG